MKISKLLEKISTTIVNSKDDVELTDEQVNNILSRNPLIGNYADIPFRQAIFSESTINTKDLKYICKTIVITSDAIYNIDLRSLHAAFKPSKLTIRTTEVGSNTETFCEVCNVTVMGDPQLINFSGVLDGSLRGNSIVFSNELDVSNWSVFGTYPGQGLILDIRNPHPNKEIKVEILMSGYSVKGESLGQNLSTETSKLLFSKITCKANDITKVKILAGRGSAFSPNFMQMNHFEKGTLEIVDISVLKKQQIEFLTETSSLSIDHFSKLRPVKFDTFGSSENRGLEITFKNNFSFDIINYITLLGEPTSDDLVGIR